jgi:hypothetical protein
VKIQVAADYDKKQVLEMINSFDEKGETFYAKRNTIKIFQVGEEEWNIKSFKIPHLVNKIAYRFFRKSKAQRSFEYATYLLQHGILTPKPIAFLEKYTFLGLGNSFYVSENLHYDLTFRELIHDKNYPDRENILQQFTNFTFQLHEKGIHFLDHSPGNTLIVTKEKQVYDFYLIDLNRMNFGAMDFESRMKNFAKLTLTDDMIAIISKQYAVLSQKEETLVKNTMTEFSETTAAKRAKKQAFKKKIGK